MLTRRSRLLFYSLHFALALVASVDAQWVHKPSLKLVEDTPGLRHEVFDSTAMKEKVGYSVVVPPTYDEGDKRYPVVYWLHGGGGNECSSVFTSKVWLKLYASAEVEEVILIYPNGFRSGYMDHVDGKVMVETMVIEELIPRIDQRFRTIANREGRALHGFSMGASGALKFAINYPELFCSAVAYGGGAIDLEKTKRQFVLDILKRNLNADLEMIRHNNTYHYLERNHEAVRQRGIRFLLICGEKDTWLDTAQSFHAVLTEKRISSELRIVPKVGHQLAPLIDAEGASATKFQNTVFAQ